MASLYKRGSFWWLEFRDASGNRVQHSTGLRHASAHETREARRLRDTTGAIEPKKVRGSPFVVQGEAFASWVGRFLAQRYSSSPLTFQRARYAWDALSAFFREREINTPRQVSRQICRDFFEWRIGNGRAASTAIKEIKILGMIMGEALQSGFCDSNPCLKLGLSGSQPKKKAAITFLEHLKIIYALRQLRQRDPSKAWMLVAYRIGYWQGCRISETCFPLAAVDLGRNVIGIRTKGRKSTVTTFPIVPKIRPLLRRLIESKSDVSCELPGCASTDFIRFFKRIGLSHLCFHCLRVTAVTRLAEAGVPLEYRMRMIGHTSYLIHEQYSRLEASDPLLQEIAKSVG